MTFGKNRECTFTAPDPSSPSIPARRGDETANAALLDARLCASLLIVVVIVVAVLATPHHRPLTADTPGWTCAITAVIGLVTLSSRSYLRVVRYRRG